MADNIVSTKFTADGSGFTRTLGQMGGSLGGFVTTGAAGLAGLAAGFGLLGLAAVKAGVSIMSGFVKKATMAFIDFEETFVRTKAIMGGVGEESDKLKNEIIGVATASLFTARQVGEASQILALAGLTMSEMVDDKAIENLVKFSIAAGTDAETAAAIGIASVKSFGLEINQLVDVADVMTKTFTSSFTTLETLGETMKFVGPAARAAGVGIEEAAAAAGALGNAGLQGSLAGTGLRMALMKMLRPSVDARRMMDRLGFSFMVLTPAGEAAKASLKAVTMSLDSTQIQLEQTTLAVTKLDDAMSDLSVEQQRNSIEIQKIRLRASRDNRDLTEQELSQISRLEVANSQLSIQQQELSLEANVQRRAQRKLIETQKELEGKATSLNTTINEQTTGVTSLEDMLQQFNDVGLTTAQVMMLFEARAGTAMLALMGQRDAFLELKRANEEAGGTLEKFSEDIMQSTAFEIGMLHSAWEKLLITIGAEFGPILKDEIIPILISEFIPAIVENKEVFVDLAKSIVADIIPALKDFVTMLPDIMSALRMSIPFFKAMVAWARVLMTILKPVFWLLSKIGEFFNSSPITQWLGTVAAGGGTGALVGGTIGAVVGIPAGPAGMAAGAVTGAKVGAGTGAVLAGIGGAMADGGIVTKPTIALIGEAGPEAVVPLTGKNSPSSGTVINLSLGGVNVGAGNAVTASEVRGIVENTLPDIIKRSMVRGNRRVI